MGASTKRGLTKEELVVGLRSVGLEAGHHVVVHSSLSSFGYVERGAHAVIDALEEVITPEGTLVMPTFSSRLIFFMEVLHARSIQRSAPGFRGTLRQLWEELKSIGVEAGFRPFPYPSPEDIWNRVCDEAACRWEGWNIGPQERNIPETETVWVIKNGPPLPPEKLKPWEMPVTTGRIPETFWHRPESRRSEHYSGSFTAWGALTDKILERHDNHSYKAFEDHPLYRMKGFGGKILLLGVDHRRNSTIHVAESAAIRARGVDLPQEFLGDFMIVDEPLTRTGGQRIGRIGEADVRFVDTRVLYDVVAEILDRKLRKRK